MKLRYIITSLLAALALLSSCSVVEDSQLKEVQVSQSYVAIPVAGGDVTITVTATQDWNITDVPEWLTVSPTSGAAGETNVTFSAKSSTKTYEAVVKLNCGAATQIISVLQMAEKVELPISSSKVVNAAEDGVLFRVKGVVRGIENYTYGNYYIDDADGSVYVYGTLNNGASKEFSKLGIEAGDIITVEGPRGSYKGSPQLVDVTVIAIEKSLIKVEEVSPEDATLPIEGGEFTVTLTVKGEGVDVKVPEAAQSWLSVKSVKMASESAEVTFLAAANDGGDRSVELTFVTTKDGKEYSSVTSLSQKGAIIDATADVINNAEDGDTQYRITGYVSSIVNTQYGNLYIKDATGEVYVYGTLDAEGNSKNFSSLGINEGDIITVVGPKTSYNGSPQMKNVSVEVIKSVEEVTVSQFLAKEESSDVYYSITGKVANIKNTTYGNFDIVDESGSVYVYGLTNGWGGQGKQFESFKINEGDQLTILGVRTSYKDTPQVGSAFYVDHQPAGSEEPGTGDEPVGNVTTLTSEGLPTAYSATASDVTLGGLAVEVLNVANFGNGIQMKKKDGDVVSYLSNKAAMAEITKIRLNVASGKTWYKDNMKVSAGATATELAPVTLTSSDDNGSTYEIPAGCKFFKVENTSGYAVYMGSIEITTK